jgi:hypothetical protein
MAGENLEIINNNAFLVRGDTIDLSPQDYLGTAAPIFNFRAGAGTGMDIRGEINKIEINFSTIASFNLAKFDSLGNVTLGTGNEKARIEITQQDTIIRFYSSDPMEWKDKAFGIKSKVKTGFADNNVDLSGGNYEARVPGVYRITAAGNTLRFPDAASFPGQSFTIINASGAAADLSTNGGQIFYQSTGVVISQIGQDIISIFYSDGSDYYGVGQ